MVDIRPEDLPPIEPLESNDVVIVDQRAKGVRQGTSKQVVDFVAPVATQAKAVAGLDDNDRMTALKTKQSISSEVGSTIASYSQGQLANTAVQPSRLVSSGAGLSGGGSLATDRTLSLSNESISSLLKADTSIQPGDNKLIPSGGAAGQVLGWGDGTTREWVTGTGDMLKSVYDPSNLESNSFDGYPFKTREEIKGLNTDNFNCVYLSEFGREGHFVLKEGVQPSSDEFEGLYITSETSGYYWSRIVLGPYQFSWFGVIADDETDNAPYVQSAIDNLPNIPCSLLFQSGIIRINGEIQVKRGYISISGEGIGSTVIRQVSDSSSTFVCRSTAPNSIQSLVIKDIGIGVITDVEKTSGVAIYIEKGDGVILNNLGFGGHFVEVFMAGCFGVHMTNCRGSNGYLTPLDRKSIIISNSSSNFGGTYGGNIFIDNCDFRTTYGQSGTAGSKYGMEITAVDGIFVSNSYFGYFDEAAIAIRNLGGFIAGVNFNNCWFDHESGAGVNSFNDGTTTSHHGGKFTGCTFVGGNSATYNYIASGYSSDIQLNGCAMSWVNIDNIRINTNQGKVLINSCNIFLADYDDSGGGEGIVVSSGDSVVISSNVIDGNNKTDNGIILSGGNNITVTGNIVRRTINGILTQGSVNGYIINSNNTLGVTGNGILDNSTGPNKSVVNNI